jgi:hypothetical protein
MIVSECIIHEIMRPNYFLTRRKWNCIVKHKSRSCFRRSNNTWRNLENNALSSLHELLRNWGRECRVAAGFVTMQRYIAFIQVPTRAYIN